MKDIQKTYYKTSVRKLFQIPRWIIALKFLLLLPVTVHLYVCLVTLVCLSCRSVGRGRSVGVGLGVVWSVSVSVGRCVSVSVLVGRCVSVGWCVSVGRGRSVGVGQCRSVATPSVRVGRCVGVGVCRLVCVGRCRCRSVVVRRRGR